MTPGEKYRDLGGGVYEDGPPPAQPVAQGRMPSCSLCGSNETVEEVHSPNGRYQCGPPCWTLFDSTDAEWRRHRSRREAASKRRRGEVEPLPAQKFVREIRSTELEDADGGRTQTQPQHRPGGPPGVPGR